MMEEIVDEARKKDPARAYVSYNGSSGRGRGRGRGGRGTRGRGGSNSTQNN